jgi:glycosyltransferase involved in cell wall biosynthesis
LKKALYSAMIERDTLRRSSCLRALTNNEVEDYRRYGVHGPVAVIPNGVEAPPDIKPDLFLQRYPYLEGKRIVLFLGRIHPKKGPSTLCRAWCRLGKQVDDAHLVIAGPNSGTTKEALQEIVSAGRVAGRVTFTGMLNHTMKWSALAAASLFVLPSHSEGFSIAALEALAMGVPVVISQHCNFPEVTRLFCGWETEVNDQQLEQSLAGALALAPEELQVIGSRGRELVRRDYSWSAVGFKMRELQNWILYGTTPSTVQIQ